MVCLEGDALAWYYYEESRQTFRGWSEFKKMLLECFRSSQSGNMMEQLLALWYTSSVGEYCHSFELLSVVFLDLPEAVRENAFANGLQEKIKFELRLWESKGLGRAMKVAQMLDNKNNATSRSRVRIPTPTGKVRQFTSAPGNILNPRSPPSPTMTISGSSPFSALPFSISLPILFYRKHNHTHKISEVNRCRDKNEKGKRALFSMR